MHVFFGFPFQITPLLYVIGLAALSGLGALGSLGGGLSAILIVLLVQLLIALVASNYFFRIVQQVSRGLLRSSDFMTDWQGGGQGLPWKLLGVLLVWGLVAGLVVKVHPVLGWLVNMALSLALPAIIATLVLDESFVQSLNPGAWLRVMQGVGWSYFLLVLFVFLLSQGSGTVLALLMPRMPPLLLLPVLNAVLIYFYFVMASMLGYMLYQHHAALGIDLQHPRSGERDADADRAKETDRHVGEMVTSGNLGHAIDIAYEAQRTRPEDLKAHARYHQVLCLSDRHDTLGHHAARYIPLLIKADMTGRAWAVYQACKGLGVPVSLDHPDSLLALARYPWRQGDAESALALVQDFETRYPGHALVPAALEFLVRVMVQGLHRKQEALALVQKLEARYPTSPHTEEARWLAR